MPIRFAGCSPPSLGSFCNRRHAGVFVEKKSPRGEGGEEKGENAGNRKRLSPLLGKQLRRSNEIELHTR